MEATIVNGNGTETGHIIVTTIGGKNGQPKQVWFLIHNFIWCISLYDIVLYCDVLFCNTDDKLYGRACRWARIFWSSIPGL